MANRILDTVHYEKGSMNLFIAHNYHVGTSENAAGRLLRDALGGDYAIVQTTANCGKIRFDAIGWPNFVITKKPITYKFSLSQKYRTPAGFYSTRDNTTIKLASAGFTKCKISLSAPHGDYIIVFERSIPAKNI
jgi:hypothetical protein